jgi:hypothetical protein
MVLVISEITIIDFDKKTGDRQRVLGRGVDSPLSLSLRTYHIYVRSLSTARGGRAAGGSPPQRRRHAEI